MGRWSVGVRWLFSSDEVMWMDGSSCCTASVVSGGSPEADPSSVEGWVVGFVSF